MSCSQRQLLNSGKRLDIQQLSAIKGGMMHCQPHKHPISHSHPFHFSFAMTVVSPNLYQPIKVGRLTLSHRVVLSPMTRMRTNPANGAVLPVTKEYYAQRASRPGTLLFTEGAIVAPRAGGFPGVPGFWSEEQMASWKEVSW